MQTFLRDGHEIGKKALKGCSLSVSVMLVLLTVFLFMKTQIPAATSQANKTTRQPKNCRAEQKQNNA